MAPKKKKNPVEKWTKWLIDTIHLLIKCGLNFEDLRWNRFCDEYRRKCHLEMTVDELKLLLDSKLQLAERFEKLLQRKGCKWDSDRSMITYAGQNTVVAQNILRDLRREKPQQFNELKFIVASRSKSFCANPSSVRQEAGPSSMHNHSLQSARPPMGYPFWQPAVPYRWRQQAMPSNASPFFHFGEPSNANPPESSCSSNHMTGIGSGESTRDGESETS